MTFPLMRTKVTAISQLPVFPWKLARSTPDRGPSNYAGALNIWEMSIPCRRVIGRSVDDVNNSPVPRGIQASRSSSARPVRRTSMFRTRPGRDIDCYRQLHIPCSLALTLGNPA